MLLIVGLGNPGPKYANNRHNIGFMAVDEIVRRHNFAPWKSRFSGMISEGRVGTLRAIALKPMTYMNLSGQSVGEAMRYYKLEPNAVVVLHDELDVLPGRVKTKRGGGAGGHNGLKSIDEHIGRDYLRVRLGIGHPGSRDLVTQYVLSDFAKVEYDWIDTLLPVVSDLAPLLGEGDGQPFTSALALKYRPPELKTPAPSTNN